MGSSKLFKRLGLALTGMALAIGVGVGLSQRGEYKEYTQVEAASTSKILDGAASSMPSTASTSNTTVTQSNYSYVVYNCKKQTDNDATTNSKWMTNTSVIFLTKTTGKVYNTTEFTAGITGFELFTGSGASTSAVINIEFSATSVTSISNTPTIASYALSSKGHDYDLSAQVPSGSKYFCIQATSAANVQIGIRISTGSNTVTYNANGGTGSMSNGTGFKITIAANTFTRDGYTFTGWNTHADGTGDPYSAGDKVDQDLTLYAQWLENNVKYHVTYDANTSTSGSAPSDATDYSNGDSVTVLGKNTLTKTGNYVFMGWNTLSTGKGIMYKEGDTFSITEDKTLYAIWYLDDYSLNGAYKFIKIGSTYLGSGPSAQDSSDSALSFALSLVGDNTFTFKNSTNYLVWTSSTSVGISTGEGNAWEVSQLQNGLFHLLNVKSTNRYLGLLNSATWKAYTSLSQEGASFDIDLETPVKSISVAVTGNVELSVGGTATLTATRHNGATGTIGWSIVDNTPTTPAMNVVSISSATGDSITVTGVSDGLVNVRASLTDCEDVDTTFAVNRTVSSIAITTAPSKTSYNEGESFSNTGMVVTATYDDTSTSTVNDYTWSPAGALTDSDDEITISYQGKTATQAITVTPRTITGISVKTNPTKMTYHAGDKFVDVGLELTATYNVGDPASITSGWETINYTFTNADLLAGTKSITITYSGQTTSVTCNVVKAVSKVSSDTLNNGNTINSSENSYSPWTANLSNVNYSGNSGGDKTTIQLRSNNEDSGVVSTSTCGTVKKVTVTFHKDTANTRTVNVYGSNNAYVAPSELYGENIVGDLVGTLVCEQTNPTSDRTVSYEFTADYKYIGLRSNSGALYLKEIVIEYNKLYSDSDVADVDDFVETFMHMDKTANEGKCLPTGEGNGENWYDDAKDYFKDYLSASQKDIILNSDSYYDKQVGDTVSGVRYKYSDIKERLSKWALANGEVFNADGTFSAKQAQRTISVADSITSNSTLIVVVIISAISATVVGGYFFIRRRKER